MNLIQTHYKTSLTDNCTLWAFVVLIHSLYMLSDMENYSRYVFGVTHIPRLEDWLVMPVERIGFTLWYSSQNYLISLPFFLCKSRVRFILNYYNMLRAITTSFECNVVIHYQSHLNSPNPKLKFIFEIVKLCYV